MRVRPSRLSAPSFGAEGSLGRNAHGLGSTYKEPSRGGWVAEKRIRLPNGQHHRIRARAKTEKEALRKRDQLERAARDGFLDASKTTTSAFMRRWFDYKRPNVRASTFRTYERDWELARPALGNLPLARVTPMHIQGVLTSLQNKRSKRAPNGAHAAADKVRRTLKQAFGQAVRWGVLPANPADRVDPVPRPPVERGVLTPHQAQQLLRVSEGSNYHAIFAVAITAGLRKGELLALEWRDITPSGIHVRRTLSLGAKGGTAPPKTRAGARFVPTPSETISLLGEGGPHKLVFPGRGGGYRNPRNTTRALHHYLGVAGLPKIRFHDLRRTYATLLAAQGTHPRVIQKLLGHSTPTLAMTIYTDVLAEQEREAVVGGLFGGAQE